MNLDKHEIEAYLRTLWPSDIPSGYALASLTLPYAIVQKRAPIDAFVNTADMFLSEEYDCYLHMGLIETSQKFSNQPGKKTRPTINDIRFISAVWVDLDPKGIKTDELRDWITNLPFKPSLIVHTGNGYHAYWVLDKPVTNIVGAPLVSGFQHWIQGQAHFHIDSTFDLARVMRIPGTYNLKDKSNPKYVSIIAANNLRYDPSEIPVIEKDDRATVNRQLPDIIPEGGKWDASGRDDLLFKLLCSCRRFGCTEAQLMTIAFAMNEQHLDPPLSPYVVKRKVYSALKYRPRAEVDFINQRNFNEQAIDRFLK